MIHFEFMFIYGSRNSQGSFLFFFLAYQCPTVPAPFFNSLTPFASLALYEQFISSLLHLSKIVFHTCIGQELSFER